MSQLALLRRRERLEPEYLVDDLSARLAERIRRVPAIEMDVNRVRTDEAGKVLPPRPPNPTLAVANVEYVEQQLGFRLPTIVRRLAIEVADGGYGPAWGINRLKHPPSSPFGPFWMVKMSVESWHRLYQEDGQALVNYPLQFIRYCELGCNIAVCVDCTSPAGSLFLDDPNRGSDAVEPLGQTVEEWLWEWLNGKPWPTDRYPSLS